MEQLHIVGARSIARSKYHITFQGISLDNRRVEIEVCVKQRKTRNAKPKELHFCGRIDKKRLTPAQARALIPRLTQVQQTTFLHPSAFGDPVNAAQSSEIESATSSIE